MVRVKELKLSLSSFPSGMKGDAGQAGLKGELGDRGFPGAKGRGKKRLLLMDAVCDPNLVVGVTDSAIRTIFWQIRDFLCHFLD